jgi:predicted GIY-YIG superfamily endonuclease
LASQPIAATPITWVFHYVYILVSESDPDHHYVGLSSDLKARLAAHNAGKVSHTTKYKPWRVETAVAFGSKTKATAFERYLKSGSGREFARRHF